MFVTNKAVLGRNGNGNGNLFSNTKICRIFLFNCCFKMWTNVSILISNSNFQLRTFPYECENHVTHECNDGVVWCWDKSTFGNRYTCCQVHCLKGMSLFLFTTLTHGSLSILKIEREKSKKKRTHLYSITLIKEKGIFKRCSSDNHRHHYE